MSRNFIFFFLAVVTSVGAVNAQTLAPERVTRIVDAYGGAAALTAIAQVEAEWAGYFMGRYQSRYTDPPYDRMPWRNWSAFDLKSERSVADWIATYAGELNLNMRAINDGRQRWWLDTTSRIYTEGGPYTHELLLGQATNRMPLLLVRELMRNPGEFAAAPAQAHRGITYEVIRRGDKALWIHPDTSLIYAVATRSENLVDVQAEVLHTYTNYFRHQGVMFNRRHQVWTNGEVTMDNELYNVRFNHPIDTYLRLPKDFVEVESLDEYNGVTKIGVEKVGDGVFLVGTGDTRVLYVEFADHFVAMEAGHMPYYTEQAHQAMQPHMSGKPLRYIIPTHHHDDHAVSVHFYTRMGAAILTTRDKEGFMRRLLARAWDKAPPVTNASFRFIDGPQLTLADGRNRLDVLVHEESPHAENMLVAYLPRERLLYSCDAFIGWIGEVRQGASFGTRRLAEWLAALQAKEVVGPVNTYASCHGRAYSAAEFARMLATERTIVTLPSGETWPSATWFQRYGLSDDTTGTLGNPRRERAGEALRQGRKSNAPP